LVGVQVPQTEHDAFDQHLQDLDYPYWDESQNSAYRLFLA
jgi:threonine dehydratase